VTSVSGPPSPHGVRRLVRVEALIERPPAPPWIGELPFPEPADYRPGRPGCSARGPGGGGLSCAATHQPPERYRHLCADLPDLVALEADEPVDPMAVDNLPVVVTPRTDLQLVHNSTSVRQAREPVAQSCGVGRS